MLQCAGTPGTRSAKRAASVDNTRTKQTTAKRFSSKFVLVNQIPVDDLHKLLRLGAQCA